MDRNDRDRRPRAAPPARQGGRQDRPAAPQPAAEPSPPQPVAIGHRKLGAPQERQDSSPLTAFIEVPPALGRPPDLPCMVLDRAHPKLA